MRLSAALFAIVVAAFAGPAAAQVAQVPDGFTETKARLGVAAMEVLVVDPMRLARSGNWTAAQRSLEQLVERRREIHGASAVEVADTLVSFMILNYNEHRQREALAYAPRVIDIVRQAWGSDHIEYALLLNDLVMMDFEYNKDAVGPQSEAALLEAHRIRAANLGPRHVETVSTLIYLGEIQGLRSRTGGELARALPAITTLRTAISTLEAGPMEGQELNLWARTVLAKTFARNGAVAEAVQAFNRMLELATLQKVDRRVSAIAFAETLQENGHNAEADAIMKVFLDAHVARSLTN